MTKDRLELVKCYTGAVGIAGTHARTYYVEVTNADVRILLKNMPWIVLLSIIQKAHAGGGLVAEGEMIEVIDLPFAEAKEMVTCQASEDKIENYDATFLFLMYWFLYNKESTVIRKRFQKYENLDFW